MEDYNRWFNALIANLEPEPEWDDPRGDDDTFEEAVFEEAKRLDPGARIEAARLEEELRQPVILFEEDTGPVPELTVEQPAEESAPVNPMELETKTPE